MNSQKKTEIIISFNDIHKTYITGPVKYEALKGITFNIIKGEFVAVMGRSGSGKSTIMNIIGALDMPTSGKYTLNGKKISGFNASELAHIRNREIGFIFQSFNLLPRITVFKNIERPMMYADMPKDKRYKRVYECLEVVGLANKVHSFSNHLSGGEIQRVAIARALVMNPSILLADEPTGNLDSKTAHEIMHFFSKLNQQGTTVVLITHEKDIARFAKRTIQVKDGKIESDRLNGIIK